MPTLPSIEVTAAQATRIQDAFGGIEEYRAWLRQAIKDYVLNKEASEVRDTVQAQIDAIVNQVNTDLDGI